MDKKLRNDFILSLLAIVIGAANIALFWFKGIVVFHPFIALIILIAGFFLFVVILLRLYATFKRFSNEVEDLKKEDEKLKEDGWESMGDGLYRKKRKEP